MHILKNKKFYIETLGCKVNQYESDAMRRILEDAGAVSAPLPEADICIVNTCSVTNMADHKSRQMLHHAKKIRPDAVIVAAGCYVQAQGEKLLNDGAVDILIGNDRKSHVAEIIAGYLESLNSFSGNGNGEEAGQPQADSSVRRPGREGAASLLDIASSCEFEALPATLPASMTRAYLKIQDGCNAFCTYCIIPYVRGRIRNKPLDSILSETAMLADRGIREVVLTGIHISAYDDAEKKRGSSLTLTDTIQKIAEIPGIERIRLSSLEPRVITPSFLDVITGIPKVCPHFHLSLQSANNDTLKRMNRHYTIEEFMDITRLLREAYDRPALTTDVIVGFPGETDAEFEDTYRNLETLNFYEMHVFKYSRRKGTLADKMPDQIPENTKNERSRRLLTMTASHKAAFESSFSGEDHLVLAEEVIHKDGKIYLRGHTERYILVDVPYSTLSPEQTPEEYINQFIRFRRSL